MFALEPAAGGGEAGRPADIERFTELDEDLPPAIAQIARRQTLGATTDFERAWLLQWWFRDSGDFEYSTDVSTGHGVLVLEDVAVRRRRARTTGPATASSSPPRWRSWGAPSASRVAWCGDSPRAGVQTQADGTEVIVVRDNNAHAWVEMWMDGFGWVKFDPTPRGDGTLPDSVTAAFNPVPYLPPPDPNAPDIDRPGSSTRARSPANWMQRAIRSDRATPGCNIASWWWMLPALVVLAAGIPLLKEIRRRRRIRRIKEGDITAVWDEMVDRLADLGQPVPGSSDTARVRQHPGPGPGADRQVLHGRGLRGPQRQGHRIGPPPFRTMVEASV